MRDRRALATLIAALRAAVLLGACGGGGPTRAGLRSMRTEQPPGEITTRPSGISPAGRGATA